MIYFDNDWEKNFYKKTIIYSNPNFLWSNEMYSNGEIKYKVFEKNKRYYDIISNFDEKIKIVIDFDSQSKLIKNYNFEKIAKDIFVDVNTNISQIKIIIFCIEEPLIIKNFTSLIEKFADQNISYNNIIFCSPTFYEHNFFANHCGIYHAPFNLFTPNLNEKIVNDPTHHFIALAKSPRLHRIKFITKILEKNLQKYGNISCGVLPNTGSDWDFNSDYKKYIPKKFRHLFPLQFEDEAYHKKKFDNHKINGKIKNAFLNIVFETGYEITNNIQTTTLTEKSGKPFFWGHVPLFVSGKHTIKNLRKLKFDLFDDLLNHDYDNEPNPYKRMNLVINELEKITKYSISDLVNYKKININRFLYNRNLALEFYNGKTYKVFETDISKHLSL